MSEIPGLLRIAALWAGLGATLAGLVPGCTQTGVADTGRTQAPTAWALPDVAEHRRVAASLERARALFAQGERSSALAQVRQLSRWRLGPTGLQQSRRLLNRILTQGQWPLLEHHENLIERAEEALEQGHVDARLAAELLVLAERVHHPRLALLAGAIALQRRDQSGAQRWLTLAARLDPEHPAPFRLRGLFNKTRGDLRSAAKWLSKTAKLNPFDERALAALAPLQHKLGRHHEAARTYRALRRLEQSPSVATSLGLASSLQAIDAMDDALLVLDNGFVLHPRSLALAAARAQVAVAQAASRAQPNAGGSLKKNHKEAAQKAKERIRDLRSLAPQHPLLGALNDRLQE